MKKVFNDISTLAHLWANKTQSEARNSIGSLYYHNDTIYSYRDNFAIGKHVERNGQNKVLITLRTYSNTTAKHISVVRNASNHLDTIYCYSLTNHEDNFKTWLNEAKNIGLKLLSARKPENYINQLNNIKGQVDKYVQFFEIDVPITLTEAINVQNKEEFLEFSNKLAELQKIEAKKKLAEAQKRLKKDLTKWYNFETAYLYTRIDKDYLRYNTEKNRFETTQRVEIPFAVAKKFYECLQKNILKVGDSILDYTINYIDKKIVKIGCHTFEVAYLNQLATKHF
jgi:hypothetical protein